MTKEAAGEIAERLAAQLRTLGETIRQSVGGDGALGMPTLHDEAAAELLRLRAEVARLREALAKIAAPTYGTELRNSDAENYEIVSDTLFWLQGIARAALAGEARNG